MSFLKKLLNKSKETNPVDEESLNSVLREFDKKYYNNEGNSQFLEEPETAYDIIALVNNLRHYKLNIYKDRFGKGFIRTNLGFQPLTVYNREIENIKLRSELDIKVRQNSDLKTKLEKALKALATEREMFLKKKKK